MVVAEIIDKCQRCDGVMTPFIDKGEDICVTCGWVKYLGEIPPHKPSNKKRGRPRGYTRRKGFIRRD